MKLGKISMRSGGVSQGGAQLYGVSLASFWLTAFVGTVLLMALGIGAWAFVEHDREQALLRAQTDLRAEALQQRLSQSLGFYYRILKGLTNNPGIRQGFLSMDIQVLAAQEQALKELLPNALRVRLLEPRHHTTDLDAEYPLSFAALELLRAAEVAEAPPLLEIHQSQGRKSFIAGATAIRSADGVLIGLLHVMFNADPIRHWLNDVGQVRGRIELRQRVEGRNVTLFTSPNAEPVNGEADVENPVTGSQLLIAYWHNPGSFFAAPAAQGGVLLLAVLLVLSGLLFFLQYKRMRKALDADQAVLIHLLEDTLSGKKQRGLRFKVKDFAYTLELLKQRLKVFEGRLQAAPNAAADAQQGAAADARGDASLPTPSGEAQTSLPSEAGIELPALIFRTHDIRGRVGETITDPVVKELGRAIGSQAYDQGQQTVIVARDCRESGQALSEALVEGLNAAGQDVIDLGMMPVPVLYFATHFLGSNTGVMVTAQDGDEEDNGLQIIVGGEPVIGSGIQALRERVERGDLLEGSGSFAAQDLLPDYMERIVDDVSIARPLKLVIDCGSGCSSLAAPSLYRSLGCELIELFCAVDSTYPGHEPEPSRPENLEMLRQAVVSEQADLGIAFNGDGDRLVLVDSEGHVVWPDRIMMLLAADVLARHPGGDVIYDVKCSRALASQILQYGGRPVMWKSGSASLKEKLRESGALLAGEWRGHIVFRERWYGFDDGMYVGARVLEILSMDPRSSAEVFAEFPDFVSTPELFLDVQEGEQFELLRKALDRVELLGGAKLTTIDGLRAEFEDGWGLMCSSDSRASVGFRFEADTEEALARVQGLYRALLADIAPHLQAPF